MRRILWIVLGCVGVGLGAVGAVLPLLPAFPFLLLAAFSFAKSSQRLHTWFINTSLYKKNLESYVQHRAMTWRTKRRIMERDSSCARLLMIVISNSPLESKVKIFSFWK